MNCITNMMITKYWRKTQLTAIKYMSYPSWHQDNLDKSTKVSMSRGFCRQSVFGLIFLDNIFFKKSVQPPFWTAFSTTCTVNISWKINLSRWIWISKVLKYLIILLLISCSFYDIMRWRGHWYCRQSPKNVSSHPRIFTKKQRQQSSWNMKILWPA